MRFLAIIALLAACSGDDADTAWMAAQPDERGFAELSVPGTHDSAALFEPYPGLARTQDLTIEEQLAAGVRSLDLRCRHVEDHFLLYHGSIDQNLTFEDLLATLYAFLDAHPTETILASIKEEATPSGNTRPFDATVAAYIADAPERWYLAPTLPHLGDVRGKIILLRRFATTAPPLGIDAAPWADNASFQIANAAHLQIEDEYVVTDNNAKWSAITRNLTGAAGGPPDTLYLTFTSGYQEMSGLSNIPIVADDINARLDGAIADAAGARLGVLVMDHVTAERVAAVAEANP